LDDTIAAVGNMDSLPKDIMREIQRIWEAG
jgi:hypothetical protein